MKESVNNLGNVLSRDIFLRGRVRNEPDSYYCHFFRDIRVRERESCCSRQVGLLCTGNKKGSQCLDLGTEINDVQRPFTLNSKNI